MSTPGTFPWAVAQLRAGHSIRRASWPFYWLLSPTIDANPSQLDFVCRYGEQTPSGVELLVGQVYRYTLPSDWEKPDESYGTPWGPLLAATDWETVDASTLPEPMPPGHDGGEAIVLIPGAGLRALASEPERLAGYRKITAFVPDKPSR